MLFNTFYAFISEAAVRDLEWRTGGVDGGNGIGCSGPTHISLVNAVLCAVAVIITCCSSMHL
jgi:hypothetical protein